METRVLFRFGPKPNTAFLPPNDAPDNFIVIGQLVPAIFTFESLDRWKEGWMDTWPPARVPSYKLTESLRLRLAMNIRNYVTRGDILLTAAVRTSKYLKQKKKKPSGLLQERQ